MKHWLQRIAGKKKDRLDHITLIVNPVELPASAASPVETSSWQPSVDVDGLYYSWLLNLDDTADDAMTAAEQRLLAAIDAVSGADLVKKKLVPRMPHVVPQLLRDLRDERASNTQLSAQIAQDPQLVARVIRQANSSAFLRGRPVTSIEQALMLLGETGLRQLIASVMLHPIINVQSGRFTRLAAPRIWAQSQKCAILCRSLAGKNPIQVFEAYLAGLLQSVGLTTALRIMDAACGDGEAVQTKAFSAELASRSRALSVRISQLWELPAALTRAMEEQGPMESGLARSPLGQILYLGDQLGKMRVMINQHRLPDEPDGFLAGLDATMLYQYEELRAVP